MRHSYPRAMNTDFKYRNILILDLLLIPQTNIERITYTAFAHKWYNKVDPIAEMFIRFNLLFATHILSQTTIRLSNVYLSICIGSIAV